MKSSISLDSERDRSIIPFKNDLIALKEAFFSDIPESKDTSEL